MNRRLFLGALTGAGVALSILGIGYVVAPLLSGHTAPPMHIEADELRYLCSGSVPCDRVLAQGDSKTNMQCEVSDSSGHKHIGPCSANAPAAQPSDDAGPWSTRDAPTYNIIVPGDVPVDGGAYVYDGKKWRKVPVVQGDCTILKSGAMVCCGGPGRPACDDGPGPMQGQWMAQPDQPSEYVTCAQIKDGHSHCEADYYDTPPAEPPPAVLKGPPTQVCVYDFVGSPYLRLNKAVSDPSCADFDSAPPAVLAVPPAPKTGDCFVYGGEDTFEKVDQCPVTDDNSEELEQDDYNNEITEGSQI